MKVTSIQSQNSKHMKSVILKSVELINKEKDNINGICIAVLLKNGEVALTYGWNDPITQVALIGATSATVHKMTRRLIDET